MHLRAMHNCAVTYSTTKVIFGLTSSSSSMALGFAIVSRSTTPCHLTAAFMCCKHSLEVKHARPCTGRDPQGPVRTEPRQRRVEYRPPQLYRGTRHDDVI